MEPGEISGAGSRERSDAALQAGLHALGLPLAAGTRERLLDYVELLAKWNAVYNLTAIREPDAMLVQHVFDSLAIVRPLSRQGPFVQALDVGSGGGLPGIVLALVWPDTEVHLVEPVGKKVAFLQQCVAELRLDNARIHRCRVETLSPGLSLRPDLVVCRAFASLPDFVGAVERLATPRTTVAAMKGMVPQDEIDMLPPEWEVAEIIPLSVPRLEGQRNLIMLQRVNSTGQLSSPVSAN